MSTTDSQQGDKAPVAPARSIMPPFLVLRDFLDEETVAGLLNYALARQADFTPTRLGSKAVNPAVRVSLGVRDLGPYRQMLQNKVLGVVPKLIADLRMTPVNAPELELQLVAHGDGAFYKRHIDTQTAHYDDLTRIRVLSGVYYFNNEPKAFTGGALRLYSIADAQHENFFDIEPERNSLLVFPSWAPHEVMPVSCRSKRFIDSRFAVNCWIHRMKSEPTV